MNVAIINILGTNPFIPPEQLHDINQIPHFPFEPGALEWSLLAGLLLALAAFIIWRYWRRKRKPARITQLALKELSSFSKKWDPQNREQLAGLSILIRRCLSSLCGQALSSCGIEELEAKSKSIEQPELRKLLDQVLELEQARFRPNYQIQSLTPLPQTCIELLKRYDNILLEQENLQKVRK